MRCDELVSSARSVAASTNRRLGATRYVAASILLRQALECALDELWDREARGLATCSARAQLVTLPFVLDDADLAGDVAWCWHRLSSICHHSAYELPPSPAEVERLAGVCDRLLATVA